MAASGLCQPIPVSVFSNFSVYSVLRFCERKNKGKGFNTEGAEKVEGTEKSSRYGVLGICEQNFLGRSGLRIMGIGRMKLNMVKRARLPNVFAGKLLIQP